MTEASTGRARAGLTLGAAGLAVFAAWRGASRAGPLLCNALYLSRHGGSWDEWAVAALGGGFAVDFSLATLAVTAAVALLVIARRRHGLGAIPALAVFVLGLPLGGALAWAGLEADADRVEAGAPVPQCVEGRPRYRPGSVLHWSDSPDPPEPAFTSQHHALGARGSALSDDGAPRVLMVGDSFMFGLALADDETIPAGVAARRSDLRTVNFGLPGAHVEEALDRALEGVGAWRPRVVVVSLHGNDTLPPIPVNDCLLPRVCRLSRATRDGQRRLFARWDAGTFELTEGRLAGIDRRWSELVERGRRDGFAVLLYALSPPDTRDPVPALVRDPDPDLVLATTGCQDKGLYFGGRGHPNPEGAACMAAEITALLPAPEVLATADLRDLVAELRQRTLESGRTLQIRPRGR